MGTPVWLSQFNIQLLLFGSGHDFRFVGLRPPSGSMLSMLKILSPPSAPLPHSFSLSLSLSLSNKKMDVKP